MASEEILLLLIFGDKKKKISLKNPSIKSFRDKLESDVSLQEYNGNGFIYQVYDHDFDEFVELDNETVFENKMKIKVVTKKRENMEGICSPRKKAHLMIAKETENEGSEVVNEGSEAVNELSEAENEVPQATCTSWIVNTQKESVGTGSRTNFSLTYTLPDLSETYTKAELYAAIPKENKGLINRELINILFHDILKKYSLYPPSHMLVAQKLVSVYPHLKQNPNETYEPWYKQLRAKYKNFRFSLKGVPAVQNAKKKYGKSSYKIHAPGNLTSKVPLIAEANNQQRLGPPTDSSNKDEDSSLTMTRKNTASSDLDSVTSKTAEKDSTFSTIPEKGSALPKTPDKQSTTSKALDKESLNLGTSEIGSEILETCDIERLAPENAESLNKEPEALIISRKSFSPVSGKTAELTRKSANHSKEIPSPPIPVLEDMEDGISVKQHIKYMQLEMRKNNKDWVAIDKMMDRTYSHRRDLIENQSLQCLLETYPSLCNIRQINLEFQRVTGINIEKRLAESLQLYSGKIWNLNQKESVDLRSVLMEEVDSLSDKQSQQSAKAKLSLMLIPGILKECHQSMFSKRSEVSKVLVSQGAVLVYSGNNIFCSK